MNCFALTSRSEGMPQSLLEACVAGIPVIASNVGGIPEVIKHGQTGLLVEPGDECALAEGLAEILGWPARTQARSKPLAVMCSRDFTSVGWPTTITRTSCTCSASSRPRQTTPELRYP